MCAIYIVYFLFARCACVVYDEVDDDEISKECFGYEAVDDVDVFDPLVEDGIVFGFDVDGGYAAEDCEWHFVPELDELHAAKDVVESEDAENGVLHPVWRLVDGGRDGEVKVA